MNLKQQHQTALQAARAVAEKAQVDGGFTPETQKTFNDHLANVDVLAARIKTAERDEDRLRRIGALGPALDGEPAYLRFHPKSLAETYVKHLTPGIENAGGAAGHGKALLGPGTGATVPVELGTSPVDAGRPAQGLLDVLVAKQVARDFSYLRQTTRDNAAAFVAPGAVKPTSAYTLTRIEDRLRVVAHLSEPVDRFWLEDAPTLAQFVGDELAYGLRMKLEDAVLNGNGVDETPFGLAATSGIQTQTFQTSPILTSRSALTLLETVFGDVSGFYVMHPSDWQAVETATAGSGAYVLAEAGATTPIDRAQRRLWGQPVALSLACTPGTGWLVARDAVSLYSDVQGIRVDWATSGDDFTRNQVRARCEGRFALAIARPLGVVKINLTGA